MSARHFDRADRHRPSVPHRPCQTLPDPALANPPATVVFFADSRNQTRIRASERHPPLDAVSDNPSRPGQSAALCPVLFPFCLSRRKRAAGGRANRGTLLDQTSNYSTRRTSQPHAAPCHATRPRHKHTIGPSPPNPTAYTHTPHPSDQMAWPAATTSMACPSRPAPQQKNTS